MRLSNLQRGLVAVPLSLQLGLERVGFGLQVGLDATGFVLSGELGLEFGARLDGAGLGSAGSAAFASPEQAHPGCLPVIVVDIFADRGCEWCSPTLSSRLLAPRVRPIRGRFRSSSKPQSVLVQQSFPTARVPAGDAVRGWLRNGFACAHRRIHLLRRCWPDRWWYRWRDRLPTPDPTAATSKTGNPATHRVMSKIPKIRRPKMPRSADQRCQRSADQRCPRSADQRSPRSAGQRSKDPPANDAKEPPDPDPKNRRGTPKT